MPWKKGFVGFMSCILLKSDGSTRFSHGLVLVKVYFANCTKSVLGAKKQWVIYIYVTL